MPSVMAPCPEGFNPTGGRWGYSDRAKWHSALSVLALAEEDGGYADRWGKMAQCPVGVSPSRGRWGYADRQEKDVQDKMACALQLMLESSGNVAASSSRHSPKEKGLVAAGSIMVLVHTRAVGYTVCPTWLLAANQLDFAEQLANVGFHMTLVTFHLMLLCYPYTYCFTYNILWTYFTRSLPPFLLLAFKAALSYVRSVRSTCLDTAAYPWFLLEFCV